MRTVVASLIALPWVVWAVVRTAGFELDYPLVAVVSFTPYAALSSPLPVVLGLLLRRWAVAGVAARRDDLERLCRPGGRAGDPADRARARRRRPQSPGVAAGADAPLDRAGALEQFPARSVDARAAARADVEIMAGDFNATLDHRELRALLDHVLVDRRVRVERVTVLKVPGSDHRAVIAELRLPAG